MLEAGLSALQNILTFNVILHMLLGVGVGLVIGVLPGLGGSTGMALLLPFLFGMDPYSGVAMMVGYAAVGQTSDTFPSVLLGVPGSAGSQATILDGYALARKGEAARALGSAFSASLLGGVFGALTLLAVLWVARDHVQGIGSPELLMFTVLGIATIGVLVRGDAFLGFGSALLGLMLGTVGAAPSYPEYRFVFDQLYLRGGLSIVVVALGFFAFPEVLTLLVQRMAISDRADLQGSAIDGFWETWKHKFLVVRSAVVGTIVGAIPGLGGAVVDWISYGIAKQTVRDSSQFGRGDIRGVIAPESANNAKEGGVMIPTLVLGIPGSGTSALLLGGLVLLGFVPGPGMLRTDLDVTLTVVWVLVLANIVATATCFVLAKGIARITLVPGEILAPMLIAIFLAASFQVSNNIGDILVVVVVGLIGFAMKLASWPRAPAIIGFVLAPSMERYLQLSMDLYGIAWMRRSGVIAIGVVTVLLLVGGPATRRFMARRRGS